MPRYDPILDRDVPTDAERALIVRLARARGIAEGSASDRQLVDWLANRPAPEVFERATRLVRAMLSSSEQPAGVMTADELVKYSETIAEASGGIFGLNRISGDERTVLAALAAQLKAK